MSQLKEKIVHGVFWQTLERCGSIGITFVISVILARLLTPRQFGLVALAAVLIDIATAIIDSGLPKALIQKQDVDETDCNSVFYLNITLGVLMYGIIFPLAPFIARFYKQPELTVLTRCITLSLIITSWGSIQRTMLSKKMLFHLSFKISWLAQIPAGIIGILLAYKGFGVWALIIQHLTKDILGTSLLWFFVKWRPQRLFNFSRLKSLFSFSWKLLVSSILSTIYNNIYSIIVGKLFVLDTLSFYRRGRHLPGIGMNLINHTIGGVLFPAFSKIQNDKAQMRALARRGLKNIMFLVLPVMGIFFVIARPLIVILYTEKWLMSATFLQICCFYFVVTPFHTMNLQIITACGHSDYFLYLEIYKKIEFLLLIVLTYRFGIIVMTCCVAANSYLSAFINGWPNRKLIGYPPWRQFADIMPLFLIAISAGAITKFFQLQALNNWLQLIVLKMQFIHTAYQQTVNNWLQLIAGTAIFSTIYFGLAAVTRQIPKDIFTLATKIKSKFHPVPQA